MPVQKQSSAGQRTRFKAFVAIGDACGHRSRCKVFLGGRHRDSWCDHLGETQCRPRPSWVLGTDQWHAPYRSLSGDRKMWFGVRPVDSRTPWDRTGVLPGWEEIDDHGRNHRLLYLVPWTYPNDGKFHQGHVLCAPEHLWLFKSGIVERQSSPGLTLPRTYRFPLEENCAIKNRRTE